MLCSVKCYILHSLLARSLINTRHILVTLLRLLGLSVTLEPLNLFSNLDPDDNRRSDILIRNPHGGGKQIILDVAVTGIDGTTRTNEPMMIYPINLLTLDSIRKKQKYERLASRLDKMVLTLFQLFSFT